MYHHRLTALLLVAALVLSGCAGASQDNGDEGSSSTAQVSSTADGGTMTESDSDLFTQQDYETGYDEGSAAQIQLEGTSAQADTDAVEISDGTVTITDEGTYLLSGNWEGMVLVDADKDDQIQLVLDGVSISNASSAALYVRQADHVYVTTAAGTENQLSNGGEYVVIDDNNIDAVLFSKDDLTLNGEGTLSITAQAGHGVVSKDSLVITSGIYDVTAASHGFSGKDSIAIAGGTFTIQSGKDGIQAENDEDASLGFLHILDGTFAITAEGDGLSGGSYLQIEGGSYTLTTGGGSQAAVQEGPFTASQTEDSVSTKGIKAAGDLTIQGGEFVINSADDAVHSNANLLVSGGTFEIATGDDGFHADTNVTISDGCTIDITESYEGIEGLTVDITGGQITLVSSDDGLNAAGGNDQSGMGGRWGGDPFGADADAYIHISGGILYLDASGDGIDSNGDLTVSGGELYLSGPDNGGNGALDYGGEAVVTGGTVIAAGASQMAQNFGADSTQGVMLVTFDRQEAGSTVTLTDESGQELLSWAPGKAFDSVVISCPELEVGGTYIVTAGTGETTITLDSLVYGSNRGMGGGFGGGRGPGGGGRGALPEDGQQPSDGGFGAPPDGQQPGVPGGEEPPTDLNGGGQPAEMPAQ